MTPTVPAYVINSTYTNTSGGPSLVQAGTLVTDATLAAALVAAGAGLVPSSDPNAAAAAVIVNKLRAQRGADEAFLSRAMLAMCSQGQQFAVDSGTGNLVPRLQSATTAAAVAGVTPALTTLAIPVGAKVWAIPATPGGTQGIPRISTLTPGAAGASSIVVTSSSGTDTSTFTVFVLAP